MSLALLTRGMVFPASIVVLPTIPDLVTQPATVPTPLGGRVAYTIPNIPNEVTGIAQSDILIRAMLVRAIHDLRHDPGQLSSVFASLKDDDLFVDKKSGDLMGPATIERARAWFLATEIPVKPDFLLQPPEAASFSTSLVESTEAEATLADLHYNSRVAADPSYIPLAGPFAARSYDPANSILVLPTEVGDAVEVVPGMEILDATGLAHTISEVLDSYAVILADARMADFRVAYLRLPGPRQQIPIESLSFRETYRVGVHIHGDPEILLWAHSIAMWALLRYKQQYLENRGFERPTFSSGPFGQDKQWDGENRWVRFVNITGFVRNVWAKDATDILQSVRSTPTYSPVGVAEDGASEGEPGVDDPIFLATFSD